MIDVNYSCTFAKLTVADQLVLADRPRVERTRVEEEVGFRSVSYLGLTSRGMS